MEQLGNQAKRRFGELLSFVFSFVGSVALKQLFHHEKAWKAPYCETWHKVCPGNTSSQTIQSSPQQGKKWIFIQGLFIFHLPLVNPLLH